MADRTDETPERYWVFQAFSHYDALEPDRAEPTVIRCGVCDGILLTVSNTDNDNVPLLMWQNKPICMVDAREKITNHPLTPTYLQWMEEGDPRWWSPWFCGCAGCDPPLRASYNG